LLLGPEYLLPVLLARFDNPEKPRARNEHTILSLPDYTHVFSISTALQAVLENLRVKLTGPQPARKAIRRPWRHVTDLQPGDILAKTAANGQMALFRVVRVDDDRVGAFPVVEWLNWRGRRLPGTWRQRRLKVRSAEPGGYLSVGRPLVYCVTHHRKKDPDWEDCAFSLVARVPTRAGDERVQAWVYSSWNVFSDTVEKWLTDE